MRVNWTDYVARQERYLDDVRQAEKWHQIRQAMGDHTESALWQAIKARALGRSQKQLRPARPHWGRGLAYQRK